MLLRQKVSIIAILSILAVTALTIIVAGRMFRQEITRLGRRDYGERIRNIEFEYGAVDTVSAASADVGRLQQQILDELNSKYVNIDELSSYPFIINGDRELILFIEGSTESRDFFSSEVIDRLFETGSGDFVYTWDGETNWIVFSHYEEWDWYTGYILSDEDRFETLTEFNRAIPTSSLVIIVLVGVLLLGWLRSQFRPLAHLAEATREIGEGRLHVRIPVRRADEIGRTAEEFNAFVSSLSEVMVAFKSSISLNRDTEQELRRHADKAGALARGISNDGDEISSRVSDLEGQIERSTSSVDEINSGIEELNREISQHREGVDRSVAEVREISSSLADVDRITEERIQSSSSLLGFADQGAGKLGETTAAIQEVAGRVEDISELLDLIKAIADQTNMLSMNAAIEAAHAGESGKGFAVVADEIRKLANDAAENSRNIGEVIGYIINRIEEANSLGRETETLFRALVNGIQELIDSLKTIAENSSRVRTRGDRLLSGMDDLNNAVSAIKERSDRTTRESRAIQESLGNLRRIATTVSDSVAGIRRRSGDTGVIMEDVERQAQEMHRHIGELMSMIDRYQFEEE